MGPIIVANLKTLQRPARGDSVAFLHALLNYHLGPPDDQLPVRGPGAADFGPRTEAKVKKFQKVNKIDIGTRFFMDGVVGPHTWAVLTEPLQATINIFAAPQLKLTPPTFPPIPGLFPPKEPVVPKLVLDHVEVQSGANVTVPFGGGKATVAHALSAVVVFLKKKDGVHVEGQAGVTIQDTPGPGSDRTDLGFLGTVNFADLPGSGKLFAWSVQAQEALLKSVTDRAGTILLSTLAQAELKLEGGKFKLTGQGGLVLEADTPGRDNNHFWSLRAGVGAFFGVTGSIGIF